MKKLLSQAVPGNHEKGGPLIDYPTKDEVRQQLAETFAKMKDNHAEHRLAAVNAREALPRLIHVLHGRSGQSFKLRRLLFSMWSGTPGADLSDVVCFDWEIRRDLCRLVLGWGYRGGGGEPEFFYDALATALTAAGLMDWFREEGGAA